MDQRPTRSYSPIDDAGVALSSDVFVFKTYATAQEKRDLQMQDSIEVGKLSTDEKENVGIRYGILQDIAMRNIIVSINGKADGVDDFSVTKYLLTLPSYVFDAVYTEVKETLDGKKK